MVPFSEGLGALLIRADPVFFQTLFAAAAAMRFQAVEAAKEKIVAVHVRAVVVDIVRLSAMGAMTNGSRLFFSQRDGQTVVENEQLPLPMLGTLVQSILNHSAVKLIDFLKPFLLHQGGIEFAADSSRAIHHHDSFFRIARFFQLFSVVGNSRNVSNGGSSDPSKWPIFHS